MISLLGTPENVSAQSVKPYNRVTEGKGSICRHLRSEKSEPVVVSVNNFRETRRQTLPEFIKRKAVVHIHSRHMCRNNHELIPGERDMFL